MKRLVGALLTLTMALGSTPAEAQVALGRTALAGSSAPTPIPSSLVAPSASLSVPSISATSSLAPALTVAPVPSAFVPTSALPVAVAQPAKTPTPIASLKTAAAPEGLASFDGSVTRSAAAAPDEPPVQPETAQPPAKRGLLQRYKDSRKKTPPLQTAFGRGLAIAALAATSAPILLGAAPAMKLVYAIAAADALLMAIIMPLSIGVWAWKKLRPPQTAAKPPPRARKIAALMLGLALGVGVGLAPHYATGPVVERVSHALDAKRAADQQQHVRWIRGGAVEDETIKVLSQNAIGRATLNSLRDRLGAIRLPTFFISSQDDSYAEHESFFDGVYINESEITSRGWTVEQFLASPELQRQLIRELDSTVTHELTHAVQGRRAPWKPGYFKNAVEAEQEAFLQEALYRLDALERDPKALNNGHDQWMLIDAAESLDGFLKAVAEMYPKDAPVAGNPDYDAYFSAQRARWPAFRVHIYQVLAARATSPASAKMYMDKAKAAAKEAGLPAPEPLVASR